MMLENNNKIVIKIIYKIFTFLKCFFPQQYPASLRKHKPQRKHFRFILNPEFESGSLLSGGIMTVEIIQSSFGLLPFICIAQSFLAKML